MAAAPASVGILRGEEPGGGAVAKTGEPGMGAGVVRIKDTTRALAMSTDGNGRYCYLNPRRGAMLALAEAARNVACAGALPIGGTNCLNFGNPERPEIMWQLVEAIEGLRADRTVVVIAHRLSTVRSCDRLVFMSHGKIEDVGTWDDLVARNADFRKLVELSKMSEADVHAA